MKTFFKIAAISIIFAFATTSAYAEDLKPYVGGGLTYFNLDSGVGSSDSTFGGFGTIGVEFNEYFAFETRLGASTDATQTVLGVSVNTGIDWFTSYLGKIQYPVSDNLHVYGLVGGTTLKTTISAQSASFSNTSTDFSYGGGAEFEVQDRLHLGVEWVQYATDKNINSPTFPGLDVWGLSGTLRYEF